MAYCGPVAIGGSSVTRFTITTPRPWVPHDSQVHRTNQYSSRLPTTAMDSRPYTAPQFAQRTVPKTPSNHSFMGPTECIAAATRDPAFVTRSLSTAVERGGESGH